VKENIPKGIIEIVGYKVTAVDNTLDSGRYGFRLDRDQERTYFFSSDNENAIRDWTKAIMKATISRRYSSMFSEPFLSPLFIYLSTFVLINLL